MTDGLIDLVCNVACSYKSSSLMTCLTLPHATPHKCVRMCVRGGWAVGVSYCGPNPSMTHCICRLTSHNLEEFLFREQLTCREVVGGMPWLNDAPGGLRLQLHQVSYSCR